jgi:hypothetical protein
MEISRVWHAKWTVIKVLFLLTRYLPYLDTAIALSCEGLLPTSSSYEASDFSYTGTHASQVTRNQCVIELHIVGWLYIFGIIMAESKHQSELLRVLALLSNVLWQ